MILKNRTMMRMRMRMNRYGDFCYLTTSTWTLVWLLVWKLISSLSYFILVIKVASQRKNANRRTKNILEDQLDALVLDV